MRRRRARDREVPIKMSLRAPANLNFFKCAQDRRGLDRFGSTDSCVSVDGRRAGRRSHWKVAPYQCATITRQPREIGRVWSQPRRRRDSPGVLTDRDGCANLRGGPDEGGRAEVRVDAAGNIFGRRAGTAHLPTLLFGSHIDSVPHGGNFDGTVGSLGAIEVIRALNEGHVTTRHPLEVVIWTNEEGPHFGISALGSGVAAGVLGPEILDRKDEEGLTLADWLRRYGQDPSHLTGARISRDSLAAILEVHIEQGPSTL